MNFADIKRTPTQIERRRSAALMKRMITGLRTRLDEDLRDRNVTAAQIRFLYEIRQRPGATGAQLSRACYVTPQSAQAMFVRAVEHGWVVRGKDPENSRLVTARLTPAGDRLLTHAEEALAACEAEIWAGVPLATLRSMNDLIEQGLGKL